MAAPAYSSECRIANVDMSKKQRGRTKMSICLVPKPTQNSNFAKKTFRKTHVVLREKALDPWEKTIKTNISGKNGRRHVKNLCSSM